MRLTKGRSAKWRPDRKNNVSPPKAPANNRDKRLPRHEDLLVGEEPGQDGDAFALRHASQEDSDQSVFLDQQVDRVGQLAGFSMFRCSLMRLSCSAIAAISSRMPMIWPWRISSSFSCSAMISISAFKLTS